MKHTAYFSTEVLEPIDESLAVSRWHSAENLQLATDIRVAILAGSDLPSGVSLVSAIFNDREIRLADLRGLNLSQMKIGKSDLTYCCLDFADFTKTQFHGTLLQYSSLNRTNFEESKWTSVQASPISSKGSSFRMAELRGCYFMKSNLDSSIFTDAVIVESMFFGSSFNNVQLSQASILTGTDLHVDESGSKSKLKPVSIPDPQVSGVSTKKLGGPSDLSIFNVKVNPQPQKSRIRLKAFNYKSHLIGETQTPTVVKSSDILTGTVISRLSRGIIKVLVTWDTQGTTNEHRLKTIKHLSVTSKVDVHEGDVVEIVKGSYEQGYPKSGFRNAARKSFSVKRVLAHSEDQSAEARRVNSRKVKSLGK